MRDQIYLMSEHGADLLGMRVGTDFALLGIRAPGEPDCGTDLTGPKLQLRFDDVAWPTSGDSPGVYLIRRPGAPKLRYPTQRDAEKIVDFARALVSAPVRGLGVHCAMGVSRSAAALVGVLATWAKDGVPEATPLAGIVAEVRAAEARALDARLRGPDHVYPNPRLVACLDVVLGYDGDLMRAVAASIPKWAGKITVEEQLAYAREDE